MSSTSRQVVLPCLLVIAAFTASTWLPIRPRDYALRIFAFFLTLIVLYFLARRRPAMFRADMPDPSCARCGYSLRGHEVSNVCCPECGSNLGPQDIIAGKDIWVAFTKRRMRRWTFLSLVLMLASPLYVPGFQPREKTLVCYHPASFDQLPISSAYSRIRFAVTQERWSFLCGPPVPLTQKRVFAEFNIDVHPYGAQMVVFPKKNEYWYYPLNKDRITVPGPLTFAGLLNWMRARGVDTQSERVRREMEAIWACYEDTNTDSMHDVPSGLFHDVVKNEGTWGPVDWPLWLYRSVTVASLLLWLLVALRIRRRAMIEASLAGPHGLATGRYSQQPSQDP